MSWYTTENMNEVCEHGSQRRKCLVCESEWQDKRIADLEAQLEQKEYDKEFFKSKYEFVSSQLAECQRELEEAFTAGRKLQREKDAVIAENTRLTYSERSRYREVCAKAIREQEIDE